MILFIYYFFAKNSGTSTLQHLQGTLEGQPLYVELLQEVSPGHSPGAQTVLATFETSAVEFLFPYPQLRPTYTSGVDVDLLMEPTRDFPGIISPKVSLSALAQLSNGLGDFQIKEPNLILLFTIEIFFHATLAKRLLTFMV